MKKLISLLFVFSIMFLSFLLNRQKICADDHICPFCGSTLVHEELTEFDFPSCEIPGIAYCVCANCEQPYQYEYTPATGHDWFSSIIMPATCTTPGERILHCNTCETTKNEVIPPMVHNYIKTVIKAAECDTAGLCSFTCSLCHNAYQQEIPPLNHNYQIVENRKATCIQDGFIRQVCSNCHNEKSEVIKATGHQIDFIIINEPSCTHEGLKEGICEKCGEKCSEIILTLEHDYPDEWTTEKKATAFSNGLIVKVCANCSQREEETIPKTLSTPALIASVGSVTVAGASAAYFILRKSSASVIKNQLGKHAVKTALKPSFETKTIMTCMPENDFYVILKAQKHLIIKEVQFEKIIETITSGKPDLLMVDIGFLDNVDIVSLIHQLNEELQFSGITLLLSERQKDLLPEVQQLKKEGKIFNVGFIDDSVNVNLVKLILPVLKPKLKSNESLKNIAMVAQALGLEGASDLVGLYLKVKSIKNIASKEEELKFMDHVSVLSNIASILGLSEVSEVTGFISSVNSLINTSKKKIGTPEAITLKNAATDVVDFIGDVSEKLK